MAGFQMHPLWRCLSLVAILCWVGAGRQESVLAEGLPENQAKTSMLYNFPKLIDWPPGTPPGMVLCVLGSDPFGPALDLIDGKPMKESFLSVRRINSVESQSCHILFVGASENSNLTHILLTLRDAPVLTVGDVEGMAARGIMIEMIVEQQRLRFKVNLQVARQHGFSISSQLLKLAKAVY
ncbi:MAG: YfiR family protein [Candidatus Competibacteraceae bacterium]|nr:YfiR family protein [Candidatus Competibacteraceae bacterium]MCB1822550.1 YfiR family protein [Candidatus Competibacteraceae bacterium]